MSDFTNHGDKPIEFCGDQEGWIAVGSLTSDSSNSPCYPRAILLGVGLGPSGKMHPSNIAAMLTIAQATDLRARLTEAMAVDRPATTPTPAPGLDLDAVERDVAHLDGPHSLFDDRTLGRVLAVCNAAPALIAEVRALRVAAEEREADMHARIRAGYDKTVADAWRAEVAKRDAEIADLRALVESQRRDYLDVRLTAELAAARKELDAAAEAGIKRGRSWEATEWEAAFGARNRREAVEKLRDAEDALAAARAVTAGVCRYLDCAASDLLAVVTSLYESRARAISDATAARGTVGGLLATAPVGSIVEWRSSTGRGWWQLRVRIDGNGVECRTCADGWPWGGWRAGQLLAGDMPRSARLVSAAEADADPNQRGPLPKGG